MIASSLLLAACGGSSHQGFPPPSRGSSPLISIFEADPQLHSDPTGTLDEMHSLGVDTVRVFMPWGSVGSLQGVAPAPRSTRAPAGFHGSDPASYPATSWAIYDAIVRAAHDRGMAIDLTIGSPAPLWATAPGAPPNPYSSWQPSARQFGAFVRAVGTRYSGNYTPSGSRVPLPRVGFWSIWNEPNYGPDLSPQAIDHSAVEISPTLYRGLLDAAWSALALTGHGPGHDTILIGETAPRGITTGDHPGNFSGMVPLRFIRALYCVGVDLRPLRGAAATMRGCPSAGAAHSFATDHPALFGASGFADHPYPQGGNAPDAITPDEPDYADLASLPQLEHTLDQAQAAYGHFPKLPIYSTEFGYHTDPPERIVNTTSPAAAALYLNWSEYISWRDPRVLSYDQYLLVDPAGGHFATGLRFADGRAKPGLAAYRMPLFLPQTQFTAGQALEVWGRIRPARYAPAAGGHRLAEIQFRAGAAAAFATVARVRLGPPSFTFDVRHVFPRSGSVRLAWSPSSGPTVFSRTVTVSAR